MKNILIVGSIILMVLLSGCSVSNYLKGEVPYQQPADAENIDQLINELTEEAAADSETAAAEEEPALDAEDSTELDSEETASEEEITDDSFIKLTINENELVKLDIKAEDLNQDKLTYKYTEPIDANGEWKTNYGDAGNYLVTVTVSDGQAQTTKKVLLVVERVNVPPIIKGIDSEITISEGEVVKLSPSVTDPNGDKVTVTISDPIGNGGVWETGYTDRGVYNVTVTATDGEMTSVSNVKLTINKKNMAPVLDALADITINEGETVEIVPVVSDPNGDEITITISDPVGNDGIWETGYTDHGKYELVVKANDGDLETTKAIVLTVNPVNIAPEIIDISLD